MKLQLLVYIILLTNPAIAQDNVEAPPNLGCVKIDVHAPGLTIDPFDSWQKWCEIDESVSEVRCFDKIGNIWVERQAYDQAHILDRREPGQRACPRTVDGATGVPLVRG